MSTFNSLIYDNGSCVGIGSTNPQYPLDVVGETRIGGTLVTVQNILPEENGSTMVGSPELRYAMFYGNSLDLASYGSSSVQIGNAGGGNYSSVIFAEENAAMWAWRYSEDNDQFLGLYDYHGTPGVRMVVADSTGFVGIGTTAPSAQLHTTGTVRFANFGAGTATFDANGNLSTSSDESLKLIEGNFTRGLDDLASIQPIVYRWRSETGYDTERPYVGFSAQNVQESIPEAVSERLTLSDRAIVATLLNAVKELRAKVDRAEG